MASEERSELDTQIENARGLLDYLQALRRLTGLSRAEDLPRHDRYASGRLNEHVEKWLSGHGPATTEEIYREMIAGGRVMDKNPLVAMGHIQTSLTKRAERGKVRAVDGDRWDVPR